VAISPKNTVTPNARNWGKELQPPKRSRVVPMQSISNYVILGSGRIAVGEVIKHDQHGTGKVITVAISYAVVDFGTAGKFKLDIPIRR